MSDTTHLYDSSIINEASLRLHRSRTNKYMDEAIDRAIAQLETQNSLLKFAAGLVDKKMAMENEIRAFCVRIGLYRLVGQVYSAHADVLMKLDMTADRVLFTMKEAWLDEQIAIHWEHQPRQKVMAKFCKSVSAVHMLTRQSTILTEATKDILTETLDQRGEVFINPRIQRFVNDNIHAMID